MNINELNFGTSRYIKVLSFGKDSDNKEYVRVEVENHRIFKLYLGDKIILRHL
jgi:hypothetical protein